MFTLYYKMNSILSSSSKDVKSEGQSEKKAQLVMGEALGGEAPMEGDNFTIESNEEILVDLTDDTLELELTHLRLRTLRGLNLQRFHQVIVCSFILLRAQRLIILRKLEN